MQILSLDLGKFKSVACVYDVATGSHEFVTLETRPAAFPDFWVERFPQAVR